MLSRFKKVLGIEGVKVELLLDEEYRNTGTLTGQVLLTSLSDQTVKSISIKLVEKYKRGRKEAQLIDEYPIGQLKLNGPVKIKKDEEKVLDFELSYKLGESPMDFLEQKNFFYKGVVKAAKFLKGVKSTYRIEATADVKGTKLHPADSQVVKFD